MRIWALSDLHVNFRVGWSPLRIPDAELCVCAGDVTEGGVANSVRWLKEHVLPAIPVLFVPGNHEFYGSSIREGLEEGRRAAIGVEDFHFLDKDVVEIGNVRFVGATLWTDFRLHGDPQNAMTSAHWAMTDYRRIKYSKRPFMRFEPLEALRLHQASRSFLEEALAKAEGKTTVVVTHHAPSPRSVTDEFVNSRLSPAFVSDLEDLILKFAPTLWIHGHVHHPFDYMIGNTRVVCNPLGYPGEIPSAALNPELVIEIGEK